MQSLPDELLLNIYNFICDSTSIINFSKTFFRNRNILYDKDVYPRLCMIKYKELEEKNNTIAEILEWAMYEGNHTIVDYIITNNLVSGPEIDESIFSTIHMGREVLFRRFTNFNYRLKLSNMLFLNKNVGLSIYLSASSLIRMRKMIDARLNDDLDKNTRERVLRIKDNFKSLLLETVYKIKTVEELLDICIR